MSEPIEPKKLSGSDLLSAFKQPSETVPLLLKDNNDNEVELLLRTPKNAADYQQVGMKAQKFGEMLNSDRVPAEWSKYKDFNAESAAQAYWVHAFCVEPKLTQRECLDMAMDCGTLIPFIYGHIVQNVGRMAAVKETEELDLLCED